MTIDNLIHEEEYKDLLKENNLATSPVSLSIIRDRSHWELASSASPLSNQAFLQRAHDELDDRRIRNLLFNGEPGYIAKSNITTRAGKTSLSLSVNQIISRKLAIYDALSIYIKSRQLSMPRIFLAEAISSFALAIKGRFHRVMASEYSPDDPSRLYPIPDIDLQETNLPGDSFDILISSDVVEHIPNPDSSFVEARRVLSNNGIYIFSIPFAPTYDKSLIRARINGDGGLEHLVDKPEYHGDPLNPGKGILAFHTFGWDVLDRLKEAGFRDAAMCYISNYKAGIVGRYFPGCILFCALK